jgi:hypothetical protein
MLWLTEFVLKATTFDTCSMKR